MSFQSVRRTPPLTGTAVQHHPEGHHPTSTSDASKISASQLLTSILFTDGMTLSVSIFSITALCFVKYVVQPQQRPSPLDQVPFLQRRRKSLQNLRFDVDDTTNDYQESHNHIRSSSYNNNNNHNNDRTNMISNRGTTALLPSLPYISQFFAALRDPYDRHHNPSGYIALCVAENKLVTDILVDRCMQSGTASAAFCDPQVYCYNSFVGMPVAREATAYFLQRWFLYPPNSSSQLQQQQQQQQQQQSNEPLTQQQVINPNHIALAVGASAILNNLFFVLGDVGDACLIPAPYYTAFENDMNLVAGIVPFAVHSANPMHGPTESDLSLAYLQCKATGLNPRFLLLTNPHNPLGVIYRSSVMLTCIAWARKRKIHTIVDEIYALSTHQKIGHEFKSVIQILDNQLGNDVHMVWAASKDFGCSGVRYGVLYTQNELLLSALQSASTFTCVSGPVQYLVSELLTDDVFVSNFLDESRHRLVQSYNICTRKLDEMVLPFIPAEAGLFIYVDFSSIMPSKTFEWEQKLSDLMYQVRVILTPGENQHDPAPGMFRICYAWVSPEALEVAMERLSRLVAKVRRMEWDDINGRVIESILLC